MLIKAKKKTKPLTQTPAPQPFETMRAEPVTTANQPPIINQAPVIEIDEEEIARLVEIEKQILIKEFETELGQKRLAAEAEIQNRLEEIEINLNNIKKREEEIENFLNQEKINLEAEKAQELEKIKNIEAELQVQFEAATKQGFEQGYNEGKNRLDAVSAEFEQIISNLHRAKESILLEIEPQISSLALEVARKILQRESRLDNKVILEQVQSAIKKITIRGGLVEISINPQDAVHMSDLEKLLEKMLDKEVRLLFKEDENISVGSCIIDTQGGQLNANFRIQIESVKLAFEKYFGEEIKLIESLDEEDLAITALGDNPENSLGNSPADTPEDHTELTLAESSSQNDLELILTESSPENDAELNSTESISEEISDINLAEINLEKDSKDENFVFENLVEALGQEEKTATENIFSTDALALMNELNQAFSQSPLEERLKEEIDLDSLDAELESILVDEVTSPDITTESLVDEEAEAKNLDIASEEANTEIIPEAIAADLKLNQDLNIEDLQALFASEDSDEILDEEVNADLENILDQLQENTPISLGDDGSNESKLIEETKELDITMENKDMSDLDLDFDIEAPSDEDLSSLEESMDALLSEVEGEDTDELEALLGSQSAINLDFSNLDGEEDDLDEEIDLDFKISSDEISEDDDSEEMSFDLEEDEAEELVLDDDSDDEEIDFSEKKTKEPAFEEFDEDFDDDYSEGSDPRFPDY